MTDSLMPPKHGGANKIILLFLIGGMVVLIAAGVIYFQKQKTAPEKSVTDETTADKVYTPTPLVKPSLELPLMETTDTDSQTETAEPTEPTNTVKRRVGSGGTIDPALVKKFISSHQAEVTACYESRLRNDSSLQGKLDLNISISMTGSVYAIGINLDTVHDKQMIACIKKKISKWRFPKPTGGSIIIAKTFRFEPKD